MFSLNVGTGSSYLHYPLSEIDVEADIDKRLLGVDVCCDLAHLPFRNDAFSNVYCFHVLEHLANPVEGLKELIRVCRGIVEIEVPHRLGSNARSRGHLSSFSCSWFSKCLQRFVFCIRTPLDFPRDIRIHVWIYPHLRRSSDFSLDGQWPRTSGRSAAPGCTEAGSR